MRTSSHCPAYLRCYMVCPCQLHLKKVEEKNPRALSRFQTQTHPWVAICSLKTLQAPADSNSDFWNVPPAPGRVCPAPEPAASPLLSPGTSRSTKMAAGSLSLELCILGTRKKTGLLGTATSKTPTLTLAATRTGRDDLASSSALPPPLPCHLVP